jgi:uncharacterized protein YuzE
MAGMSEPATPPMQVFYNRHADTLLLELMPERLATRITQTGPVIVHVSSSGQPVLLEIEEASEFLSSIIRASIRD